MKNPADEALAELVKEAQEMGEYDVKPKLKACPHCGTLATDMILSTPEIISQQLFENRQRLIEDFINHRADDKLREVLEEFKEKWWGFKEQIATLEQIINAKLEGKHGN